MTDQETEILTTLDESQRTVVLAQDGHHLVLAPPGCGKTHILASRVRWAHSHGVGFEDMLCLTFTNRAARGMINRIGEVMAGEDLAPLHVGNVHHYCSRFLFEQQVVPADSSIVSDEETISILADYTHDDEERVIRDYQSSRNYQQILFFSHLMDQMRDGHPWSLYLHPEALTEGDREALRYLCNRQKKPFAVEALIEIYPCAENYFDDADAAPREVAGKVRTLLKKMYYARRYAEYKADNHILDFEDLLLKTYDAYREDTEGRLRRYRWIQVDEVQDLNAMQLAIIDLLTAKERATVLFLGDEQQAIFSFMGAKVERLNEIKLRCKGHIHHLRQNHRAPSYLLGVLNRYAEAQLGIDSELLPLAGNDEQAQPGDLQIIYGATMEDEIRLICEKVRELQAQGTTAVVVSSNADANRVSQSLTDQGLTHFKVSGATSSTHLTCACSLPTYPYSPTSTTSSPGRVSCAVSAFSTPTPLRGVSLENFSSLPLRPTTSCATTAPPTSRSFSRHTMEAKSWFSTPRPRARTSIMTISSRSLPCGSVRAG